MSNSTDLLDFKEKLNKLKPEFNERLLKIEEKSQNIKQSDQVIKDFSSKNGSKLISITVGGKAFKTKLSNLLSARDSFFYSYYYKQAIDNKPITTSFTFDRDYKMFSLLLDYLRTKVLVINDNLKFQQLKELLEECQYYGIWELVDKLKVATSIPIIVDFKASGKYNICDYTIENISDKEKFKGVVTNTSPYFITFELNTEHYLKGCEIQGWNKNNSLWGPTNGSNATISTSCDNISFTEVGKIPYDYGANFSNITFTKPILAKYIKFSHSTSLGIGYIKFLPDV